MNAPIGVRFAGAGIDSSSCRRGVNGRPSFRLELDVSQLSPLYLRYVYNGKKMEAGRAADEAKWPGLDRIFVDLTPPSRAAVVHARSAAPATSTSTRKLYFPSGRTPDRRNEIIYCVWRPRRPAGRGSCTAGRPSRPARRAGTDSRVRRSVGRGRRGVSDGPFGGGDGSSSLDYICCAATHRPGAAVSE